MSCNIPAIKSLRKAFNRASIIFHFSLMSSDKGDWLICTSAEMCKIGSRTCKCHHNMVDVATRLLPAASERSVSAAAFWGGCLHQLRLLQGYGWKAAENCEKLNQEDETLPVLLNFHLSSLPTPPFLPSFCWRAAFGEWGSLSGHSCLSLHLHENVKYNWTPAPEEDQK